MTDTTATTCDCNSAWVAITGTHVPLCTSDEPATVIVETMPGCWRESCEASGNRGRWPNTDAERFAVTRECADALIEMDPDWTVEIEDSGAPEEHGASATPTWSVSDSSGVEERIEADTARDAAEEYIASGDWPDESRTSLHAVQVRRADDDSYSATETIVVAREPEEPECSADEHDWRTDGAIGHGGGTITDHTCAHCGCRRVIDTDASADDGSDGHRTVEYIDGGED